MELSIVIVNWNTRELLRECLDSIYSTIAETSFDVWVVDNASTDGSIDMIKADYPKINLIENTKNEGFGRANNRGISASEGDFVLLLNSDIVLTENAVDTIRSRLSENPKVGALGCRLTGPDGSVQENLHFKFPHGPSLKTGQTHLKEGVEEAAWLWAALIMVKREVFDEIGVFDEDFFIFYEDTDWCRRARQAGWIVAYCPDISVIHGSRQSANKLPEDLFTRWLLVAEHVLYRKQHSHASYLLFAGGRFLYYGFRVFLHKFLFALTRSEWNKTRVVWFSKQRDSCRPMLGFRPGMNSPEDIERLWGKME